MACVLTRPVTVEETVSVMVSMTLIVPLVVLATYRSSPFGPMAMPVGNCPTEIEPMTERVVVSITLIVFRPLLATYTLLPSGVTAIPFGWLLLGREIVATNW